MEIKINKNADKIFKNEDMVTPILI